MRWMKSVFGAGKAAARNAQRDPPAASRVDALVRAGYDRESESDVAGAERFYRQAVELDPAHAEAHYFLARIAAWDRRFGEAISLCQTATESNPGEATYLFELGNALRAAGRFEESLEVFRACLALLPESVPVRINLAVDLIELDRREEARIDLERLRDLMQIGRAHV